MIGLALLAWCAASVASAQAPAVAARAPAAPGSYVEARADGSWISTESLDGGTVAIASRGAYALHEAFELGGGWGWRAHWLSGSDGLGALARVGLVPWTVWVGTGFTWTGGGFGARLAGSMGPRLVSAWQLDTRGEAWSLGLSLAAAHAWPVLEARVDADVEWLNREAPSVAFGAALTIVAGDSNAPVRPTGVVELRGSNDLGVSPRLHLGVFIQTERTWGVRALTYATLPDDREGFRVGIEIALLLWRAPASRHGTSSSPDRPRTGGSVAIDQ